MKRIAFVDLDGVVADNTERFKRAEEAKAQYKMILEHELEFELINSTNQTSVVNNLANLIESLYWQKAFDPELVSLDTLIDGAVEAIGFIECYPSDADGYQVMYLTSRPETMRKATEEWLFDQQLSGPLLTMKTSAFMKGYIKTVPWKAGIIQTIASLFGTTHVLFVDDEQANRDALVEAVGSFTHLIVASSLADAVGKLKEDLEG